MKKINAIFLLVLLHILSMVKSMHFSLQQSKVQANREWTRVYLGVKGGAFPYEYTYTQIPKGWKQIKNHLYIPKQHLRKNRKFPCKLVVRDSNKDQIRGTVLFIAKNRKFYVENEIFDYDYFFRDDFFVEGGFSGKPQLIKQEVEQQNYESNSFHYGSNVISEKRTIEQSKKLVNTTGSGLEKIVEEIVSEENLAANVNKEIQKVQELVNVQVIETSQKRSIQSIFSRLPSSEELDEIIITTDVFAITKTIQKVITDENLLCDQKIAYLLDFSGRIKSAVEIKTFTLSQLKVIMEGASLEINRLNGQIEYAKSEIEGLQIKKLRDELKKEVNKLQEAYNAFNEVDSEIEPKEIVVVGLNHEITSLREKANQNREFIVNKKLQLTKVEAEISNLEEKLNAAKNRKASIESEIEKLSAEIVQVEASINKILINIKLIEKQIEQLNTKSDGLKRVYSGLEIAVERMRSDLSRSSEKQKQFRQRIDELQERLITEEQKLVAQQISLLEDMVKSLSQVLPSIHDKIDKIYYECYKASDIKKEQGSEYIIYVMNSNSFSNYIESAYSITPSTPSLSSYITFKTIDIFNSAWSQAFGLAFDESELAQTHSFSFASDFNCLNPSSVVSNTGKIVKISHNFITVSLEDNSSTKLRLGACSRLESTSSLPKIGQQIYWKGNLKNNIYEVYSASCYGQ